MASSFFYEGSLKQAITYIFICSCQNFAISCFSCQRFESILHEAFDVNKKNIFDKLNTKT